MLTPLISAACSCHVGWLSRSITFQAPNPMMPSARTAVATYSAIGPQLRVCATRTGAIGLRPLPYPAGPRRHPGEQRRLRCSHLCPGRSGLGRLAFAGAAVVVDFVGAAFARRPWRQRLWSRRARCRSSCPVAVAALRVAARVLRWRRRHSRTYVGRLGVAVGRRSRGARPLHCLLDRKHAALGCVVNDLGLGAVGRAGGLLPAAEGRRESPVLMLMGPRHGRCCQVDPGWAGSCISRPG